MKWKILTLLGLLLMFTGAILTTSATKDILLTILKGGAVLLVITGLVIAIILLLANLGAYFTKVPLGTTIFFSAGDNLKKILPNVGGYRVSGDEDLEGRRWLVPAQTEKERMESFFYKSLGWTIWFQMWLWKKLGIRFISWFWPQVRVYRFDIRKGGRRRIETRDAKSDAPLRSRMVDSKESTEVNSLLFLVPRPVYLEGVELAGDNSRINLLLLPVFRQVVPVLPVFYLKGDFFTLLDAAIEAALVDFFANHRVAVYKKGEKRGQLAEDTYVLPKDIAGKEKYEEEYEKSPLTYALWIHLTKAGEGSPMEQQLRRLNVSKEYLRNLKAAGKKELAKYVNEHLIPGETADIPDGKVAGLIPNGMVPRFGFALVSFRVVEWEVHTSTVALANALLAKETELHTAEGVRQKAAGESDAIKKLADAQSQRYQQLVSALIEKGVTPNVAAAVVQTHLRTENIGGKDSKIVTYVEGGAEASVMVPASTK